MTSMVPSIPLRVCVVSYRMLLYLKSDAKFIAGPNAPFNFEPGLGYDDSYVSSIETWIKAGVPASKISPGLAFYGRSTSE